MNGGKHSPEIEKCKNLILFMDLQPRLLGTIKNEAYLMESNAILAKSANLLNIETIITEQVPEKLGVTHESIKKHLINPKIIIKETFSAFGVPEFSEMISDCGANRLILAGIETPICIFFTAVDALRKNIDVTILSDCVGCRKPMDGNVCLTHLIHSGVEVIPLESFLFRNLKSSIHSKFKEVSNLIRNRSVNVGNL